MENKLENTITNWEEGSESDHDSLSFCNLSMQDHRKDNSLMQSPRDSLTEEFFEFSSTVSLQNDYNTPATVVSGKIIHEEEKDSIFANKDRSSSLRFSTSQSPQHYSSYNQIQKVNLTSLTSMSAKSRRRMFMFAIGPVKFKPEMELSAIKERQGRRVPTTMFPAPVDGDRKTVVSGGKPPRGKSSRWGMMMSTLRGRSSFTTVLAKSLGCISPAGAGMEKWIRVAN